MTRRSLSHHLEPQVKRVVERIGGFLVLGFAVTMICLL